jgi:hypothetical protein
LVAAHIDASCYLENGVTVKFLIVVMERVCVTGSLKGSVKAISGVDWVISGERRAGDPASVTGTH